MQRPLLMNCLYIVHACLVCCYFENFLSLTLFFSSFLFYPSPSLSPFSNITFLLFQFLPILIPCSLFSFLFFSSIATFLSVYPFLFLSPLFLIHLTQPPFSPHPPDSIFFSALCSPFFLLSSLSSLSLSLFYLFSLLYVSSHLSVPFSHLGPLFSFSLFPLLFLLLFSFHPSFSL